MTEPTTHTLDVPGATLSYDVRGDLADATRDRPALLLVGSPMGAAGFTTLASHFTDRPVVTYDPRGVERSVKAEPESESTPEQHADDIHRIIDALGIGPVDLFGTSGGAVNGVALVTRHPEQVRTFVAHEPPLATVLPDRDVVLAVCEDIGATYEKSGMGPAMAKFITLVTQQGPLPASYLEQPAPDPAMFGLPTEDDGSRDDALVGQNIHTCCFHEPDVAALTAASTRIVVAQGEESADEVAGRGAAGLAALLGREPTVFPSDHGGFFGGEYGQQGKPEEFATTLRHVIDQD